MKHLKISAKEKQSRLDAVSEARSSVALSGFKLSPEEIAHGNRYIEGEIDLEEFVSAPVFLDGKEL